MKNIVLRDTISVDDIGGFRKTFKNNKQFMGNSFVKNNS